VLVPFRIAHFQAVGVNRDRHGPSAEIRLVEIEPAREAMKPAQRMRIAEMAGEEQDLGMERVEAVGVRLRSHRQRCKRYEDQHQQS
jgi:hypothetical protein